MSNTNEWASFKKVQHYCNQQLFGSAFSQNKFLMKQLEQKRFNQFVLNNV